MSEHKWDREGERCEKCKVPITPDNCGTYIGEHSLGVVAGGHPDPTMMVPALAICRDCSVNSFASLTPPPPVGTEQVRQLPYPRWAYYAANEIHNGTWPNGQPLTIIAAIIAKHAQGEQCVVGRAVISKPGAALEVAQLELSDKAKAGLSTCEHTMFEAAEWWQCSKCGYTTYGGNAEKTS